MSRNRQERNDRDRSRSNRQDRNDRRDRNPSNDHEDRRQQQRNEPNDRGNRNQQRDRLSEALQRESEDRDRNQATAQQTQPTTTTETPVPEPPPAPAGPSPLELALARAQENIAREFSRRGLDVADYQADLVDPRLASIEASIPADAVNFDQYLPANLGATIIGDEEGRRRGQFSNQISGRFGTGFENTLLPNTADDDIIGSLLDDRFMRAQTSLDRALQRGDLSAFGYQNAYRDLQSQRDAGMSLLTSLGDANIDANRQALRGRVGEISTAAGNYSLGDTFDLGAQLDTVDQRAQQQQEGLRGGLLRSLGGTAIFNPGESLNVGGASQGFVAGGRPEDTARTRDRTARRGVGNTGAF